MMFGVKGICTRLISDWSAVLKNKFGDSGLFYILNHKLKKMPEMTIKACKRPMILYNL